METVAKMILSDFQRGRLPYFVPPPKAENKEVTAKSKDSKPIAFVPASDISKPAEEQAKKLTVEKSVPGVKQDLTKINVEPEFVEEDIDGGAVVGEEEGIGDEEGIEEEEMEEEELDEEEMEEIEEEIDAYEEEIAKDEEVKKNGDEKEVEDDENIGKVVKHENKSKETENANSIDKLNIIGEDVCDSDEQRKDRNDGDKNSSKKASDKKKCKALNADYSKKVDDEISFKITRTTSGPIEEEESDCDAISKIKAKIEGEDEDVILSSLTPEEKLFLGIAGDEVQSEGQGDETEESDDEDDTDDNDDEDIGGEDEDGDTNDDVINEEVDNEEETNGERKNEDNLRLVVFFLNFRC